MRPFRAAVAGVFGLVPIACSSSPPPRVQSEPPLEVPALASAAPAPVVASAPPVVTQPDVPNAYSWQHPEVIDRLVNDCRWRPPEPPRHQRHPLSCRLPASGEVQADPCLDEYENTCNQACSTTCSGCASACVTTCESCKAGCTGDLTDACKLACATQCASCRDVCARDLNLCHASTCGSAYSKCRQTVSDELRKTPCKTSCTRATTCVMNCRRGDEDCVATCKRHFPPACSDLVFRHCTASARQ